MISQTAQTRGNLPHTIIDNVHHTATQLKTWTSQLLQILRNNDNRGDSSRQNQRNSLDHSWAIYHNSRLKQHYFDSSHPSTTAEHHTENDQGQQITSSMESPISRTFRSIKAWSPIFWMYSTEPVLVDFFCLLFSLSECPRYGDHADLSSLDNCLCHSPNSRLTSLTGLTPLE